MNALVVYYSLYGNTRKVAEEIAEVIRKMAAVRTLSVEKLSPGDLKQLDLVVMGTPTHRMNLPQVVRSAFENLPRRSLQGASFAAFDTSYDVSAFLARFTASKKLDRKLRKLGGRRLLPPETFHVHPHHEGPLLDGEIERGKTWAEAILVEYRRVAEKEKRE
jgi:flavodoxin